MQILGYLLIITHFVLFFWATGGFLEMIFDNVPWRPFTNLEFPVWVLVIHWSSIGIASVVFIYGYFTQWVAKTPQMMTLAYGFMAMVCVVETFGFMTNKTKYIAMGAEFAVYTAILLILFKSSYFINYFGN
ncbi:MAG: hypothetical protein JJU02_14805 [Cryomorphaceae bacterium]|nr:hypothetical protein [Cryomorphaceae bacterium]